MTRSRRLAATGLPGPWQLFMLIAHYQKCYDLNGKETLPATGHYGRVTANTIGDGDDLPVSGRNLFLVYDRFMAPLSVSGALSFNDKDEAVDTKGAL